MKITAAVTFTLFTFLSRIQASEVDDQAHPDRELAVLQRKKNKENGQGPPNWVQTLKKFKERSKIKSGAKLKFQQVEKRGSVKIKGKDVSFRDEDIVPVKIFTETAKIVVDGEEFPVQDVVFTSKEDDSVSFTRDTDGTLISASFINESTGEHEVVLPVDAEGTYATVYDGDYDEGELSKYKTEAFTPPEVGRNLRARVDESGLDIRELQNIGSCSSYGFDEISINLFLDSSFYSWAGGSRSSAEAEAAQVITNANNVYKVDGICKQFKIDLIQISTSSSTDIVQVSSAKDCGSDLLTPFRNFLNSNSQYENDITQLFYGPADLNGNVIGCAYYNGLCWADNNYPSPYKGYGSGVNEIAFTNDPVRQGLLFGHEAGHNFDAPHVADTSDLMNPGLCDTCNAFRNSQSINAINNKVASTTCTERVPFDGGSGGCTDDPTFQIRFSSGYTTPGCAWLETRRGSYYGISYYCGRYSFFPANCCATCASD